MNEIRIEHQIVSCDFDRFAGDYNEFIVNVDQSYSESFNINEAGWIRNDISAFEMASSESEKLLFLDRLNEIKNDSHYNGLTDEEKIRLVIPRRALSDPVEYSHYMDTLSKYEYEQKKKAYDEEESKRIAEFDKKVEEEISNKVDASVQASANLSSNSSA